MNSGGISVGLIIFACIFLVIIIAGFVLYFTITSKVRKFSQAAFGTDSLMEGYKKQQKELSTTPKSVSGMTRIYEPQIQRDFPEFNWVQFKNKAETMLLSAFTAITAANAALLKESTDALKDQVSAQIADNVTQGIEECFQDVKIHQTEIAKYEKQKGKCIITLQSAVQYYHYRQQDGKVIEGDKELMKQTKYNTEIMYVQDAALANMDHAMGVTCPQCGAPVTMLGAHKFCEYCGGAITPINLQVWSLQKYYEVDYKRV